MARLKYPSTPYWPYSPAIGRDERVHPAPACFVGSPVVATEKLDDTNTLIHDGKVFARSVAAPSDAKWMAMVKKHHAWKVQEPGVCLYAENIYAVHSIEYGPVAEQETFYAFALRDERGTFASFGDLEAYAASKDIPTVPVLHRGRFATVEQARQFRRRCPPAAIIPRRRAGGHRVATGSGVPWIRVRQERVQKRSAWSCAGR